MDGIKRDSALDKMQEKQPLSASGTPMHPHFQQSALGRAELALQYFPFVQPMSAWRKLQQLLADEPSLRHLATLRRRTFLPTEVNKIYQVLGRP